MANAVNLPGNRLAGLITDLMQKIRDGVRTLDELALFLQGKNPFEKTVLAQYFATRKGLYVNESFARKILPFAKAEGLADITKVSYVNLPKNMNDSEIIAQHLGGIEEAKKNALTLNQVRTFLDNQWNGEDGPLLVDGCADIFYVLGVEGVLFAVGAGRRGGRWDMCGWTLGERGRWGAGRRVFRNKV